MATVRISHMTTCAPSFKKASEWFLSAETAIIALELDQEQKSTAPGNEPHQRELPVNVCE
jgi:hypothetical protein